MPLSLRLQGTSFETMMEEFSRYFGGFQASTEWRQREFGWGAEFIADGGVTSIRSRHRAPCVLWATEETQAQLSFVFPRRGIKEVHFGSSSTRVGPGQILLTKTTEPSSVTLHGTSTELDGLLLNWDQTAKAAVALFERPMTQRLELAPVLDATSEPGQFITQLSGCLIQGMRGQGCQRLSAIAISNLSEALIDCVLRVIPHNYTYLLARPVQSISPWHVRRAIEYMHSNLQQPLTIRQIAEEVGISVRALEYGFSDFKQTTPAAHMRMMRLEGARADLLDAECLLSIREVCLKWGFCHFGRFAVSYGQTYGEKPSETRQRVRSRR